MGSEMCIRDRDEDSEDEDEDSEEEDEDSLEEDGGIRVFMFLCCCI